MYVFLFQYEIMRKRFDLLAQTSTKMAPDAQTRYLLTLTRYLLFFYSDTNDSTRLVSTGTNRSPFIQK